MEIIAEEGAGLIVILNRRAPDMYSRMFEVLRADGATHSDMDELRDYGIGAQILGELGVQDMILLSNSHHSLVALDGYDLAVVGHRAIDR
jgi:3,4-dihydroxy 2-butanone 4-phosphate synthase/GTP cyclohydrolase II